MARKTVSDDFRVFSERLSDLMKERGLKQQDLADVLGIKRQTVSLYMTGQSMPDAEQVKNIAMFGLGIYIYAGEDLPDGYEISIEEAEKIVLTFGKYKGLTLKEIKEKDERYLYWIIDSENAKESLKNACSKLVKPVEQEDVDLLAEMEQLILVTDTDREKLYKNYKVNSNAEMTQEQIKNAIEVLKKKMNKENK